MSENPNKPREYDAVLGSQTPLPVDGVVLGGLEGVKRRLNSNNIQERITALSEATVYGSVGLELVIEAFKKDKSEPIQKAAYLLLRKRTEARIKQLIQDYNYWDLFDYLYTLEGQSHPVASMVISPDGQTLFTGGFGRSIKAWDLSAKQLKFTQETKFYHISSLDISIDGKSLASGSRYSKIKIWNIKPEKLINKLNLSILENGRGGEVTSVAFSANKQNLFSVSPYNATRNWDLTTKSWHGFEEDKWAVNCFAISYNRQCIVTGMHLVNLWDTNTGKLIRSMQKSRSHITALSISYDEKTIVGACSNNTINIWDVETGNILHNFNAHDGQSGSITSLAISNDGKTIISGSIDKTIKIWDLSTAKLKKTLIGHLGYIKCVAISPDQQSIISASRNGEIKILGLPEGIS